MEHGTRTNYLFQAATTSVSVLLLSGRCMPKGGVGALVSFRPAVSFGNVRDGGRKLWGQVEDNSCEKLPTR